MRNTLDAGRLRHRLRIETPQRTQDPATGAISTTWATLATVYGAIEPLSARDYIAAQAVQSKVSVRIVIRYRPGITATCRFAGPDGTIYTPQGVLPDPITGREYLTVPCQC